MIQVESTVADRALSFDQKQERINRLLLEQREEGVRVAVVAVVDATSEIVAAYAANYLAGLPGFVEEKNAATRELLARHPEWSAAIANLVEFADDENLERLVRYAVHGSHAPGALSIVYELAQHFPDRMRPHRQEIAPYDVFELLLPGAPNDWVKELLTNYRRDGAGHWAILLSYVRTDAARDALVTLLNGAPSGKEAFFAALVESSGVFADSREASTYPASYRGFFTDASVSPHQLDGVPRGAVPISPVDKRPSERILELRRGDLPFEVGGTYDPIYFWYEGSHPPGHVYVQLTKEGRKGLMTPMGVANESHELVTASGSAFLAKERHPYGLGGPAVTGSARIQVGGYPQWRATERFPRCPACGRGMRFLASVDSGLTSYGRFAFPGILYGFWCERCDVACTHRQL